MPNQIANSFIQDYQNKVYMELKEIGGKFIHTVQHENIVGEQSALLEVIGDTEAYRKTERHSQTPQPYDIKHDKRWVFSEYWRTVAHVDTYDQVKMIIEVKNKYAGLQANALARKKDTAIIEALLGSAYTGKKGNIQTELPVEQKMFENGDPIGLPGGKTGLSTYKMRKARVKFKKNQVDLSKEKLYIVVDPQQLDDMLSETEVGSVDYNSVKALIDGEVTKWLGFEFIEYNYLPLNEVETKNIRTNVCYTDQAACLAEWAGVTTTIDRLFQQDNDWQIYTSAIFGATRIDEKLVVTIGCEETII